MLRRNVVVAGLVALVAIALPLPALAGNRPDQPRGCAKHLLSAPTQGTEALAAVGDHLPEAAALAGQSTSRLSAALRHDRSAWLDRCGRQFYVEKAAATVAESVLDLTVPTSSIPVADAFTLHSRPGSAHVLFLDFDGHLITGTGWNSDFNGGADIAALPFDTDGNTGSFSAAERAVVIAVFQRVAEDYAPFDLDVTTADPGAAAITRSGSSDLQYGTRALVTNTSLSCGGCAGIAYVGVVDSTYQHAYTQPALAFASQLSGSPKLIADVVAHEVGHNFGLDHDGTQTASYSTGHAAWAPIMGAATSRPLSQWSNGDYAGANNSQDDLAVIAAGGAPLVADDHGSSAATATPLVDSATGIISNRTDTDWFSFTTLGGLTSIAATPTSVGADLDLRVDLLDADGATVASSDPLSSTGYTDPMTGLSSSVSLALLPAGTYSIRVDGVGMGDPLTTGYSDFGSIGRYSVALSTPMAGLPVTVGTVALPGGTAGRAYSTGLAAYGGTGPFTWSADTLPSELSLSTDGVLSGTPAATGSYTFTVTATDSEGASASRELTWVVRVPPAVSTSSLPAITRNRAYAAQLTGTGGLAPYTWTATGLPAGTAVTSAGRIHGTPTVAGTFTTIVTVHDATGQPTSRALSLRVNLPVVVRTASVPSARKGVYYAVRLSSAGGTPGTTWRVYAGALPSGLHLSSTGVLRGIPTVRVIRNVTFQVTDARGSVSRRTLRIAVG